MTAREKKLVWVVGGVLALMVNFMLVEFFVKNRRQLQEDLRKKTSQLTLDRQTLQERETWEQRSAWMTEHQARLTNESTAGVALLDALKEVAQKNTVLIEAPAIGTPEKRPYCIAVPVNFETKSSWAGLCGFLREAQQPEQFLVFEKAVLQVDPADNTRMHATFRVAKWFAPK